MTKFIFTTFLLISALLSLSNWANAEPCKEQLNHLSLANDLAGLLFDYENIPVSDPQNEMIRHILENKNSELKLTMTEEELKNLKTLVQVQLQKLRKELPSKDGDVASEGEARVEEDKILFHNYESHDFIPQEIDGTIMSADFSSDGKYLAVVTRTNIVLVNPQTELVERLFILPYPESRPNSVKFSADSRTLLVATTLGLISVDIKTWEGSPKKISTLEYGRDVRLFHPGNQVYFATTSHDNQEVLTSSAQGIEARNRNGKVTQFRFFEQHPAELRMLVYPGSATYSADDQYVLTTDSHGGILLFNRQGDFLKALPSPAHVDNLGVYNINFSADGHRAVAGFSSGQVIIWEIPSGKEAFTINAGTLSVKHVEFSPDDKYILTAGADGLTRIWDASTGTLLQNLLGQKSVEAARFSPDSQKIISMAYGWPTKMWIPKKTRH